MVAAMAVDITFQFVLTMEHVITTVRLAIRQSVTFTTTTLHTDHRITTQHATTVRMTGTIMCSA